MVDAPAAPHPIDPAEPDASAASRLARDGERRDPPATDGERFEPAARDAPGQDALVEAALGRRLRELIEAGLVDAPDSFCFSAFSAFDRCPLNYALKYICELEAAEPVPAFSFGTAAHRAFELFTRARRERRAAGEPAPTRRDLDAFFAEAWTGVEFPDEPTATAWFARSGAMLDAFLTAESGRALATGAETIAEEAYFVLPLELADGSQVSLSGVIDRLDRRADGSLELLDYKTGPAWGPVGRTYGLQLAIYALGCRDALGLNAPRRALLYFVEHALFAVRPVSAEGIEATRREVAERALTIRDSDFAPAPSPSACHFCDYRDLCPAASVGPIDSGT